MKRSDFIKSVAAFGVSAASFRLLSKAEAATSVLQIALGYPNPLPPSGYSQKDVFEYFKGALLDSTNESDGSNGWNPESWPYFEDIDFLTYGFLYDAPMFPATRGEFYDWIDQYTGEAPSSGEYINSFGQIQGLPLYAHEEIISGWPIKAVNDWAKIKMLELMFFGDFGNGGDLSKLSDVGAGTIQEVLPWTSRSSLYLLRYALIKFDTYGDCHDIGGFTPPSPSNLTVNPSARTFDFTYATGYTQPTLYEYSLMGGAYRDVTAKPMSLPVSPSAIDVGGISLRVRGDSVYELPSAAITNNVAVPGAPVSVFISLADHGTHYTISIALEGEGDFLVDTVFFQVHILVDSVPKMVEIPLIAGESDTDRDYFETYSSVYLSNVTADPLITSDGRPLVLYF